MSIKIYTVSEITQQIRDILEGNFFGLWVEGEISSLRKSSTGHVYFDLVDEIATLGCIIYRSKLPSLGVNLENGKEIIVFGSISLYMKGGEYRLKVEHIQEAGIGKKFFDLEKLKREFKAKGYFDRKRPIPAYPQRILVLSSPTGAAVRDIVKIVKRRSFGIEVLVLPISVQGGFAKDSIMKALKLTNMIEERIDVVVLARGGGSNEDLWIFNDPEIAKALFDVKFPTISAIGHEIDTTLCDFVADRRAETPSAAAEILTKPMENLVEQVQLYRKILMRSISRVLNNKEQELKFYSTRNIYLRLLNFIDNKIIYLDKLSDGMNAKINKLLNSMENRVKISKEKIVGNSPHSKLQVLHQKTTHTKGKLISKIEQILDKKGSRLELLKSKINYLSPLSILDKGYSITLDTMGRPLKSTNQIKAGDLIRTIIKNGEVHSTVSGIKKRGL